MELKDYWRILKFRRWYALLGGLLVFFGTFTFSHVSREIPVYKVTAKVHFLKQPSREIVLSGSRTTLTKKYQYPISLRKQFFKRREVLKNVWERMPETYKKRRGVQNIEEGLTVKRVSGEDTKRVLYLEQIGIHKKYLKRLVELLLEEFRKYDARKTSQFQQQNLKQARKKLKELRSQREEVQSKLDAIQTQLENDFSPVAARFPGKQVNSVIQQLSELDQKRRSFQYRRSQVTYKLRKLKRLQSRLDSNDDIPQIIIDEFNLMEKPRIKPLIEKRRKLLVRHDELSGKYLEAHPRMKDLQQQLESLNTRLSNRFEDLLRNQLINDFQIQLQKISRKKQHNIKQQKQLKHTLNRLSSLKERYDKWRKRREELTEEIEENKLKEEILTSYRESKKQLVQWGVPPRGPKKVRKSTKPWSLAMCLFLGLISAVTTAYLVEYFSSSIRSAQDVRMYFGLDTLTTIPRVEEESILQLYDASDVDETAEVFHRLAVVIRSIQREIRGNTFLLTSGKMGEGKSTICLNAAAALARTGTEVTVLDTDLRNPAIHRYLDVPNREGISDIAQKISGQGGDWGTDQIRSQFKRVEQEVFPGFTFIPSGSELDNPIGLMNSTGMRKIFSEARQMDRIILCDSPPLEPLVDAAVLSDYVDGTFMVIEEQEITRSEALQMKKVLKQVGANILGAILNKVEYAAEEYYYYYDSRYRT